MPVTVRYPIDPLRLAELDDAGWTHLTLWYANSPDGSYANAAVTPAPTTIALMLSGDDYEAEFVYAAGNPAQWFKIIPYDGANYAAVSESAPFHGGGGTTLAVLRQKLGKEIRDMRTGTATTSTNTTDVVTATVDVNRMQSNFYNNYLLNNTTRGSWAMVTSSTKGVSTTTLVVSPAITSQATGDAYELTRRFTPDEYRDAINWAIRTCYPVLSRAIVSTDILTAQNIYTFAVPHDIRSVTSVEIESWNNHDSENPATRGQPWEDVPFTVVREGMRQHIELERFFESERRLRVRGIGPLSQLYNDSDYVELVEPQTDLIVYYAASRLFRRLTSDAASSDIDRYKELANEYGTLATAMKDQYALPRPSKTMWSHAARASRGAGRFLIGSANPSNF